jgi:hypothetical protein
VLFVPGLGGVLSLALPPVILSLGQVRAGAA